MNENVEKFITKFNQAWTQGKLEVIIPLLHNDVIFLAPDFKTEISGKDACLQTIKDYINNAKTKSFKVLNTKIHSWKDNAVVSFDYLIEYEMNDNTHQEAAKEFWTMINQSDTWKIVWRAVVGNQSED
jgi:ketosteroid isomerase-like protein